MINQQATAIACRSNTVDLERILNVQSCSMSVDVPPEQSSCDTRVTGIHLNNVVVAKYDGDGYRIGERGLDHINADRADYYFVLLPLSGEAGLRQDGREVVLDEGSFSFMTTSRPFSAFLDGSRGNSVFSNLLVRVPGALLRQRVPYIDTSCAVRIQIRPGASRIMKSFFDVALSEGAFLGEKQSRLFGNSVIDAVANAVLTATEIGTTGAVRRQLSSARIREDAKHFIICRLSDPTLRVSSVAAHCRVSIRYLHSAFAAASESVESFIKETRLLRCRMALQDSALRTRPVTVIAAEWGFTDSAYFSHAYKARFGLAPSKDRD